MLLSLIFGYVIKILYLYIMKQIKGYEQQYEISEEGLVRALKRTGSPGQWLKTQRRPDGYCSVQLCKNGECKRFTIHRLVAETYIPNPNNYPQVMHLDNNPSNNHVSNLQWGTQSMNMKQCVADGRYSNNNPNLISS